MPVRVEITCQIVLDMSFLMIIYCTADFCILSILAWWCSAESVRVWTFFSHCGNLNLSCGSYDVMKHGFGLFMLRVKDVYAPLL